jgi:predicted amidohydrolase YtcJ
MISGADVTLASVLLLALAAAALAGEAGPAADLVVTNALAWTGDRAQPEAEALAVVGERIVAVGSRVAIEAWRGPRTEVLDAGVRIALGTDWYVASLDPMETLYAAVTRATLDGKHPGGWVPEQRITLAEAVSAYTAGAAYAEFQEKDKGRLVAGQLADLVVLDQDILAIPAERLRDVKVDATIVGGRVVHRRAP